MGVHYNPCRRLLHRHTLGPGAINGKDGRRPASTYQAGNSMASNIILYTNRECSSPYVLSVYATLVEKGLPFELKAIDLAAKENLQPEYRRISLTSRIPKLLDGEFSLSDSSAIIEYLEDAYKARTEETTYEIQTLMR